ncbi:MAG: hypothetical protein HUU57_08905 [Bdellovibrio sp.]|nr:hypothetical protein [Bdellovibrio sp.]
MDIKELHDLIETGIGMVVATRDGMLLPDICEGYGIVLSADAKSCTIFISSARSQAALKNIQDNGRVAISLSRPCTYKAAQIKGRVLKTRTMTDSEQQASEKWLSGYRKEIQLIGVMNETAQGLLRHSDIALDVAIDNIFVQTPGPEAGRIMGTE